MNKHPRTSVALPTSVELFSGGGGLALGVHRAGFRHLLLVEFDPKACETVRENNRRSVLKPPWPIIEESIYDVNLRQWEGKINLLAGGAPCQPFSLGGQHRGERDSRNLFPEALRAVRQTKPEAVLFENVKGLLRPSFFPYFEYVLWQLERLGVTRRERETWVDHKARLDRERRSRAGRADYRVFFQTLDAADYGVPQRRDRVFVVALRADLDARWTWPMESHSGEALIYAKWIEGSYWEEHGIPARSAPPKMLPAIAQLKNSGKPLFFDRWRTVRDALIGLPEPIDGEEHPTFANHWGIPGARRYKGHDGSPLDEPAKTLKAGVHGVPGGEATLLREDGTVRYFSIREAARIQTFPDEYFFCGARTHAMRQIGNAVPVLLGEILARQIRLALGR